MEDKFEYQIFDDDRKGAVASAERRSRVAAFRTALEWKRSTDTKQSALGREAIKRLVNREDPAKVLIEMESKWAAYKVAQEG